LNNTATTERKKLYHCKVCMLNLLLIHCNKATSITVVLLMDISHILSWYTCICIQNTELQRADREWWPYIFNVCNNFTWCCMELWSFIPQKHKNK